MRKQNWLIIAAVALLVALPLWLAPRPLPGPDGQSGEAFGGTDNHAQAAIGEIAPAYQRWFEPLQPELASHSAFNGLLRALAALATACKPEVTSWYAETHVFRIDTKDGIGRPTPEGAHRDGVDFVAVFLVNRHQIKGGETRVFESNGPRGERFTLVQPWSLLWLDDERVVHETTPIQPLEPGEMGWRDTLVITLRQGAFQDPL